MFIEGGASKKVDFSELFTVFTDGSALNNRKDACAGFAVYFPSTKRLLTKSIVGTNNIAELEAIRYALWYFVERYPTIELPDGKLHVFSDSKYAMNSIDGKYNGEKNKELIGKCREMLKRVKEMCDVEFHYVRAHTGRDDFISINNDIVDKAARQMASRCRMKRKKESK